MLAGPWPGAPTVGWFPAIPCGWRWRTWGDRAGARARRRSLCRYADPALVGPCMAGTAAAAQHRYEGGHPHWQETGRKAAGMRTIALEEHFWTPALASPP